MATSGFHSTTFLEQDSLVPASLASRVLRKSNNAFSRDVVLSALRVPLDAVAVFGAFCLSYFVRQQNTSLTLSNTKPFSDFVGMTPATGIPSFSHFLMYLAVLVPCIVSLYACCGLYSMRSSQPWYRQFSRILGAVCVGQAFLCLLFVLRRDFFFPRSIVLYAWCFTPLTLLAAHLFIASLQQRLHTYNVAVVGVDTNRSNPLVRHVLDQLVRHRNSKYEIKSQLQSGPVPWVIRELSRLELDELVVINEKYTPEELIELRNHCLENNVRFCFVPAMLTELQAKFDVSHFRIQELSGVPMIEVAPTPLDGWGHVVKRTFDIVAGLGCVLMFSPLYLFIVSAIKITSPGPLLYKHKRIGKHGQEIYVWKFRSMKWEYCTGVGHKGDDAFQKLLSENPEMRKEWEETHKLKNDPRVSAIGKFLRKTSLDELPQFFNVLGGTLSLVGPRPIVQDEVVKYGTNIRYLLTVKPGLTGLWQVSGRNDTTYKERVELDNHYIEHWNMWMDFVIMCKTALVLLNKGKGGAY